MSRAEEVARRTGILTGARDIFLDDDESAPAVERQLREMLSFARAHGSVIAIGHPHRETLDVLGRRLTLPHAAGGYLRASFASLCFQALGAQDYLAIAARFHTVFLGDTPLLTADRRNEAARFVALVDALYEAKVKLVMLAAAEPDALYPAGDGAFEFERTASRLEEMRSADYVAAAKD